MAKGKGFRKILSKLKWKSKEETKLDKHTQSQSKVDGNPKLNTHQLPYEPDIGFDFQTTKCQQSSNSPPHTQPTFEIKADQRQRPFYSPHHAQPIFDSSSEGHSGPLYTNILKSPIYQKLFHSSSDTQPKVNEKSTQKAHEPPLKSLSHTQPEGRPGAGRLLEPTSSSDTRSKPKKKVKASDSAVTEKYRTYKKYYWCPEALQDAARRGDTDTLRTAWEESKEHDGHEERASRSLVAAANNGHADTILLLLELGVNVNTISPSGSTPLFRAVHGGHGKAVRVLIESGANPFQGKPSPFDVAKSHWKAAAFNMFQDLVRKYLPEVEMQQVEDEDGYNPDTAKTGASEGYNSGYKIWPDRVYIQKGQKQVMSPSEPAYWN